ncbi:MAG: aminotransferase class III-fold pyridoxal phosphate-dependent enzyme [Proteobacteria bacterium]|nr:aminotransferase class III-fold pyridoxal phosphate-dependent enzyme [Pseudomonadota bacterium]
MPNTKSPSKTDYAHVQTADLRYVWHHLTQHKKFDNAPPPVFTDSDGMYVWDSDGNKYLDCVAGGLWTVSIGYGRASVADAVRDQLVKLNFQSPTTANAPTALFAEKLLEKMPNMARLYLATSGSEANEKAYKMVRQLAKRKHGGEKYKILYRERDYHGTTIAALASCGQSERRGEYGPMPPGFVEIPHCLHYRSQWGDMDSDTYAQKSVDAIEAIIKHEGANTIGSLVLETITAGGGVIVPPPNYWQYIQDLCQQHNILLHLDEVVCGFGRLGTWFGYEHFAIKPDFVTMGKGIASGYASLAGLATTEEVFEAFKSDPDDAMSCFRDISTYAGCLSGPAAALENMRIMEDENLVDNSREVGGYLHQKLAPLADKHEVIGEIRGMGLLAGIELVADRKKKTPMAEAQVQAVLAHAKTNGVLLGATNRSIAGFNNTLILSPALICTKREVDIMVAAIDAGLTAVFSQ